MAHKNRHRKWTAQWSGNAKLPNSFTPPPLGKTEYLVFMSYVLRRIDVVSLFWGVGYQNCEYLKTSNEDWFMETSKIRAIFQIQVDFSIELNAKSMATKSLGWVVSVATVMKSAEVLGHSASQSLYDLALYHSELERGLHEIVPLRCLAYSGLNNVSFFS